jgi:hypothetical protein
MAAFGPSVVSVTGTSGNLQAVAGIVVALQVTSAIQNPSGSTSILQQPQVKSVRPAVGQPGSYTLMQVSGESLSGIEQVMSSSPQVVARLEPGSTDTQMRINVFVRPNAEPGSYTFMLSGPRGSVPVAFQVSEQIELDGEMPKNARVLAPGIRRGNAPRSAATRGDDSETLSRAVVTRVEPASIRPGEVVEGRIFGRQLDGVTSIRSAGEGITVEILENSGSELRVRISVAPTAASGARLLSLDAGGETLRAQVQIAAAPRVPVTQSGPRVGNRTSGEVADADSSATSAGAPDLSVQVADITMSPSNPRAGDDVIFRVRVTNAGTKRVEDAVVEFSLAGTSVRLRDSVSLDAGASQNFQFEWQAAGSGRIEPRVTLDPESKLTESNRANNSAALPAFELVAAAASGGKPGPAPRAAVRERGQVAVLAGTCQGFRLTSGTEQECGGADVEFNISSQGGVMRIEAEGVRNLGAVDLGQLDVYRGHAPRQFRVARQRNPRRRVAAQRPGRSHGASAGARFGA